MDSARRSRFRAVLPVVLLLLAATAGCATNAPTVKSTMAAVPADRAVVVGKFGVLNRYPMGGLFYELQVVRLDDGKKYDIPLSAANVAPDGNSVPFFVELPPGLYMLGKWQYTNNRNHYSGERAGAVFRATPGTVTCMGGIYMGSRGTVPTTVGTSTQFKGGVVLKDDCDELTAMLKKKAPLLSPPTKQLAMGATRQ